MSSTESCEAFTKKSFCVCVEDDPLVYFLFYLRFFLNVYVINHMKEAT